MSSSQSSNKSRSSLKDKIQKPGGISAQEAVKRGQEALSEMRGDYKVELTQDIVQLTRLFKKKPKVYAPKDEWWQEIRKKLLDMRNVAGSFDYTLVTIVADNLLDYLDNVEDDAYFDDVFDSHIQALQHISTNDVRGKGGPEEYEMVKKIRAKVKDRKENAPFKRDKTGGGQGGNGDDADGGT